MMECATRALSRPMCTSPRQQHQCLSSSLISLGASKATLTTGSTVHCARRPVRGHPPASFLSPSPHFPFSFLGGNFQMYPNVERVQYYPAPSPRPLTQSKLPTFAQQTQSRVLCSTLAGSLEPVPAVSTSSRAATHQGHSVWKACFYDPDCCLTLVAVV